MGACMAVKNHHQSTFFVEFIHWIKAIFVSIFIVGLLCGIFYLIPQPFYIDGFRNLSELQKHAQTLDEWIKMDGENLTNPNYESYYQEQFAPSLFKTLKQKYEWLITSAHLKSKPIFSASFFKTILEEVTQYRQAKGWQGEFIQKIETTPTSKLIVFGPVQGTFHGLIRYLEQLKKMDIIDENLKIRTPDYYMIFLGDVVSRSPYTLEIFSIVLRLLQRNPENVIYLRGPHEINATWKKYSLRRELELRANRFSQEPIPLEKEINAFFDTLPWTLYCTIPYLPDLKLNYFKCAALIENGAILNMIDAPTYATFLKQKSHEKLASFNLNNRNTLDPEADNIIPRALIRGVKKRDLQEKIDGLKLLPPTKGVITWTVLSTTAEPIRITQDFFKDSFTIIQAAPKLENWIIHLYQRDIRLENIKIFSETSYFFFTGSPNTLM
jgi:hypothetical protein